jgi:5-methylcytosine-specific restriction enzyme A
MNWRVCPVPGCPVITTGGPCEEHRPARTRGLDSKRPNRIERGYDHRWRRFRARFLSKHSTCELCGKPATDPHHLDGLGPKGPRGFDETNLQALCHSCHSRLTSRGL